MRQAMAPATAVVSDALATRRIPMVHSPLVELRVRRYLYRAHSIRSIGYIVVNYPLHLRKKAYTGGGVRMITGTRALGCRGGAEYTSYSVYDARKVVKDHVL